MLGPLHQKQFEYDFISHFQGDDSYLKTPRQTPDVFYCLTQPQATIAPSLIAASSKLMQDFSIEEPLSQRDVAILGGNCQDLNLKPYAVCYGGHQFGHWAGQLGDGRAICLGELTDKNKNLWEVQLKGAGLTPYSRSADGKAVLRSSVREYLMSEAMHHLGVETTRAISLVGTGEAVVRDMFYDGRAADEPGAVVCRLAPSFLRFGNFELFASRQDKAGLMQLCQYVIKRFFPSIDPMDEQAYRQFIKILGKKTVELIVEWQRVGFTHGVMNTDNMSAIGLTIDYGPYSMLDRFYQEFTPNTTDLPGRRYAFGAQPSIAIWNVLRLVDCFKIIEDQDTFQEELTEELKEHFYKSYGTMMAKKMGLSQLKEKKRIPIINDFLHLLEEGGLDYTNGFQCLRTAASKDRSNFSEKLASTSYRTLDAVINELLVSFTREYLQAFTSQANPSQAQDEMAKSNPVFTLRNYLLFEAIAELTEGKRTIFEQLETAIQNPYQMTADPKLCDNAPDWAERMPGCSQLSCSS
ncbi:MAG: YdiU family protein [Oligoflexales bacterium]